MLSGPGDPRPVPAVFGHVCEGSGGALPLILQPPENRSQHTAGHGRVRGESAAAHALKQLVAGGERRRRREPVLFRHIGEVPAVVRDLHGAGAVQQGQDAAVLHHGLSHHRFGAVRPQDDQDVAVLRGRKPALQPAGQTVRRMLARPDLNGDLAGGPAAAVLFGLHRYADAAAAGLFRQILQRGGGQSDAAQVRLHRQIQARAPYVPGGSPGQFHRHPVRAAPHIRGHGHAIRAGGHGGGDAVRHRLGGDLGSGPAVFIGGDSGGQGGPAILRRICPRRICPRRICAGAGRDVPGGQPAVMECAVSERGETHTAEAVPVADLVGVVVDVVENDCIAAAQFLLGNAAEGVDAVEGVHPARAGTVGHFLQEVLRAGSPDAGDIVAAGVLVREARAVQGGGRKVEDRGAGGKRIGLCGDPVFILRAVIPRLALAQVHIGV